MLRFEPSDKKPLPKTSGMTFRPPRRNRLAELLVQRLLPFVYRYCLKGFRVQVDPASLEILKNLEGERGLLLPNHPAEWDPYVMFTLSHRLKESFYYVAAREVFDLHHGLQGLLFQYLGVYSVVRGASDKASFLTTRKILSQNLGRLVIFVEGEVSNQNDSLLPLEPGVITLAFLSLMDIYKGNGKQLDALPPLYICPLALKYFYDPRGIEKSIDTALSQLETDTGLSKWNDDKQEKSIFERIRDIGLLVLEKASDQFGYQPKTGMSWIERVRGLEDFMLTKMEQTLNLPLDPDMAYLQRVRRIRNLVDRLIKDFPDNHTLYEERLHQHQVAVIENFYQDLERVVNFLAIYDGYLTPETSNERFVEIIRRLEREVYGHYRMEHPRTVLVKVTDTLNLTPHFQTFLKDKAAAVDQVIQQVELSLYRGILSLAPPADYHR